MHSSPPKKMFLEFQTWEHLTYLDIIGIFEEVPHNSTHNQHLIEQDGA